MTIILSACGYDCGTCPNFQAQCNGCFQVQGKTFWAQEIFDSKTCPLFACAIEERHMPNCGQCAELPCKKFSELRDPSTSEEEHQLSILNRVANLKRASE